MFSIATSFTLATVTAITGIEAVSVRSSNILASDCSEIGSAALYANSQFDDLIEAANVTVGTCEVFPDSDKIIAVSAEDGNKCGSCIRVSVPGGGSEILQVFDHAYITADNATVTDNTDSIFQIPESTMARLVGYEGADIVSITFAEVVCEETTEQKVEFSDEEKFSLRLNGAFDAVTGVAVYTGGDIESVKYLERSEFTSFWNLPFELRNTSALYAFQMANLDPVFVNVDINAVDANNTVEVQLLDVDGKAVAYPSTCAAEFGDVSFEDIIKDFLTDEEETQEETPEEPEEPEEPEQETPERRDSNDENDASALMGTSFAVYTSIFAAASLLF